MFSNQNALSNRMWTGLQNAVRAALKGRGSRQAAQLAAGTAVAQLLGLAAYPALARLYSPSEMGLFGMYAAFVAVVTVGTSLRYDAASVASRHMPEAMALVTLSVWLLLPTVLLLSFGLALSIHFDWMGYGQLPPIAVLWTALALALGGGLSILRFWLVRQAEFSLFARITAKQVVVRVAVQIALGLVGLGWSGLAVGDLAGRSSGVGIGWLKMRNAWRRWGNVSKTRMWAVALRYREYPLFGFPSAVLDCLAANLPIPLLAASYGLETAGCYALVQRVFSAPISLIGGSVSEVYHSRLAAIQRSGNGGAETLFWYTARRASAVAVVIGASMILVGKPLTIIAFGARWSLAGDFVILLAPFIASQFVVTPLCRTGFVYDGQKLKFIYDIFVLCGSIAVLVAAPALGWAVERTVGFLSGVNTVGYGIYFVLLRRMVRGE